MSRIALPLVLALCAAPVAAGGRARVPAAELADAARTALAEQARAAGVQATLATVGRVDDVALPVEGAYEVRAAAPATWLRSRVGVPVQILVGGQKRASATVWFAVTAPATALVYTQPAPARAAVSQLVVGTGPIDLARTSGESIASLDALAGQRLRRPAAPGQPLRASDFEPMPTVLAQQAVRVETTRGPVRLSIAGRALSDGATGQLISVLPSGGTQPVRARVLSSEVVSLEN